MGTSKFNAGGNPERDWHPIQEGAEILLVTSCHGNRDKLRPNGPSGSYAETLHFTLHSHRHYHPPPHQNVCLISKSSSILFSQWIHEFTKSVSQLRQWICQQVISSSQSVNQSVNQSV